MEKKTYKGRYGIKGVVVLLVSSWVIAHRPDPLFIFAFDDPFPQTPFKHALQRCVQTWELIDDLATTNTANRAQHALLENAALGSCLLLQESVRIFTEWQRKDSSLVPVEDIIYLQVLVDRVATLQRTAGLQGDVDLLMSRILRDIGDTCDQMVLAF